MGYILLVTCDKEEEEPETCHYDESYQAMLDWIYFEEGTWWVYEEENSGDIDSVYVYESLLSGTEQEAFEYWSHSEYEGYDIGYYYSVEWLSESNVSNCNVRRLFRVKSNPGDYIGEGVVANFPVILNEVSGNITPEISDGVRTISVDSNYVFDTNEFGLTGTFSVGSAGSEDWDSTVFHISRHIGIVRREIPEQNKTWHLIDYHIEQ